MEHLFYLTGVRTQSFPIFINNWADLYPVPYWKNYEEVLQKNTFDETVLEQAFLFYWRNKWSKKKRAIFHLILEKQAILADLRQSEHLFSRIQLHFKELPIDVQLFLLHLLQPTKFPFWNLEVEAALGFIMHKNPTFYKRKQKSKTYFEVYFPFVEKELYEIPFKKTHQALFAFGKFLLETSIQQQKIMRF